jgi:hypothetical protein
LNLIPYLPHATAAAAEMKQMFSVKGNTNATSIQGCELEVILLMVFSKLIKFILL